MEPTWQAAGPGEFVAEAPIDRLGLFRARSGGLEAVTLNGPANPKEYAALEATGDVLEPLASLTGGGVWTLDRPGGRIPDIRRVGRSRPKSVVLGLLNRSERAERRPPNVREADVGVAAPELRLAPVPRREGRRRHAVE